MDNWGSVWLLTQAAGWTRLTPRTMPFNGTSQLIQVVEGAGWIHSWHCTEVERVGRGLQDQARTLFREPGNEHVARWMETRCKTTKVAAGDVVWVPFGWYAAATASVSGPLIMLNMPFVCPKLASREPSYEAVLADVARALARQSEKKGEDCPWNDQTGVHSFKRRRHR